MAVKQLGNDRTTAYTDGPELVMERIFDAPRELVWKVLHDVDRIPLVGTAKHDHDRRRE